MLAEKPADPVDVLETALLVKKESGSTGSSSSSLVEPVPVSSQQAALPSAGTPTPDEFSDSSVSAAAACSCSQGGSRSQALRVRDRCSSPVAALVQQ